MWQSVEARKIGMHGRQGQSFKLLVTPHSHLGTGPSLTSMQKLETWPPLRKLYLRTHVHKKPSMHWEWYRKALRMLTHSCTQMVACEQVWCMYTLC